MATDFMAQWKIMGGKSIAHCKSLDFTFLPFTFLPFEVEEDLEERNSHFGYCGEG